MTMTRVRHALASPRWVVAWTLAIVGHAVCMSPAVSAHGPLLRCVWEVLSSSPWAPPYYFAGIVMTVLVWQPPWPLAVAVSVVVVCINKSLPMMAMHPPLVVGMVGRRILLLPRPMVVVM